jgi:hypothetical protein
MAKQTIRFTEAVTYDGGGHPQDARSFIVGRDYSLDADSAAHWVKRRKAVYVGENAAENPAPLSATVAPPAPTVSAAEERAARGPLPGESGPADPLVEKDAKAITSPPADKSLKPSRVKTK